VPLQPFLDTADGSLPYQVLLRVAFDLREDQNYPAAKREDANMASEPESEQKTAQSSGFAAEAAKKTDSAISNTAQKYISRTRTKEVETAIRNKPLAATALAAAAGFIVGGGMASRPGLLILALLGRKAAREIAINFAGEMVRGRVS
jgi:ElaB/YqjD/DUF883 family membrane-anchored ribosome-binding protein